MTNSRLECCTASVQQRTHVALEKFRQCLLTVFFSSRTHSRRTYCSGCQGLYLRLGPEACSRKTAPSSFWEVLKLDNEKVRWKLSSSCNSSCTKGMILVFGIWTSVTDKQHSFWLLSLLCPDRIIVIKMLLSFQAGLFLTVFSLAVRVQSKEDAYLTVAGVVPPPGQSEEGRISALLSSACISSSTSTTSGNFLLSCKNSSTRSWGVCFGCSVWNSLLSFRSEDVSFSQP